MGEAVERAHSGVVLQALYPLGSKIPGLARVPRPARRVARRAVTGAAVRAHLVRARRTRIAAITGSAGKTTTKDVLAEMLAAAGPTLKTRQNDNHLYGLPATLLSIRPADRFAVVEAGVMQPGDMAWMASLMRPDVAVLTGVGEDHLPAFGGSQEAIAREKGRLLERVRSGGTVVASADDALALRAARAAQRRLVTAGWAADADVRLVAVEPDWPRGSRIELEVGGERHVAAVPLHGRHQAASVALALAAAGALGVDVRAALAATRRVRPTPGRLHAEPGPGGSTLLLDDYKSRVAGALAAIDVLAAVPAQRRIAVLGEVQDLDHVTATYAPVAEALEGRVDLVVAVGRSAAPLRDLVGGRVEVRPASGVTDAAAALPPLGRGDVVLLHGAARQHLLRVRLLLEGAEVTCRVRRCTLHWECTACPWLLRGPPPHVVEAP